MSENKVPIDENEVTVEIEPSEIKDASVTEHENSLETRLAKLEQMCTTYEATILELTIVNKDFKSRIEQLEKKADGLQSTKTNRPNSSQPSRNLTPRNNTPNNKPSNPKDIIPNGDSLNRSSIVELKSFNNPPEMIKTVLSAVLILLGYKDTDWAAAKKMMADVDSFIRSLACFDKENVSDEILGKLKPYMKNEEFDIDIMRKKSHAGAQLLGWVIHVYKYALTKKNEA